MRACFAIVCVLLTGGALAEQVRHEWLTFPNMDFEGGAAGWTLPTNACIDETVAHSGSRSLKLVVKDLMTETCSVERRLPVTRSGYYVAECWVRTEGVRKSLGKVGSVGAGIIVEWADKNGKWLKNGEYACQVWGTNDWMRVRCDKLALLKPADAAYAIAYLTLRGVGTAWFDDFRLGCATVEIDTLKPAEGATVFSTTPKFAWRQSQTDHRFELELSRDASFAPNGVRTYRVGGLTEFRIPDPIAPGTWYWRVQAEGRSTKGRPHRFVQTAPAGLDCLPPEVLTEAARVTKADAPVAIRVRRRGTDRPTVRLGCLPGAFRASGKDGVDEYAVNPPPGGWPAGLTETTVAATDAAGNCEPRAFWLLNLPIPTGCTAIDAEGRYRIAQKPVFPLGIYQVEPKYMAEVKAAGFELVHHYDWESSQDDRGCRRYLDACLESRLKAFVGFDRGCHTKDGILQGNFGSVARRVAAVADHPALFCWYLFDEPESVGQFVNPTQLTRFADLVRALDPYHAVVMTTWNETMNEYRATWDTHWSQCYDDPAKADRLLNEHRAYLHDASPITLLLGAYCENAYRPKTASDPDTFTRDYAMLRACALLGVVKNCNGLLWWWFAKGENVYYSIAQSPRGWADLCKIVAEVRRMRPFVLAPGETRTGEAVADGAKVVWWRKTAEGKVGFIAVNTSEKPVSVDISVPGEVPRHLELGRYGVQTEGF